MLKLLGTYSSGLTGYLFLTWLFALQSQGSSMFKWTLLNTTLTIIYLITYPIAKLSIGVIHQQISYARTAENRDGGNRSLSNYTTFAPHVTNMAINDTTIGLASSIVLNTLILVTSPLLAPLLIIYRTIRKRK